ncbi:MAG: sulfatase [Deltaproteobacteria bacterium]|nr:sulfatase [Deltaproteobacteria bacterium]
MKSRRSHIQKIFFLHFIVYYISCSAVSPSKTSKYETGRPPSPDAVNDKNEATRETIKPPSPFEFTPKKDESVRFHYYFSNLPFTDDSVEIIANPQKNASVILIVVDAFNASHSSAYGYKRDTTPFLREFAKEGVTFTNFISNSSWTRPSFSTIITGVPRTVHKMELGDNILSNNINTLAEQFKKAGYKTGAFIGNPLITKKWNYQQGFDTFIDSETAGPFASGETLVNLAKEWLEHINEGEPFFLTLFLTDPHAPYTPPINELKYLNIKDADSVINPSREFLQPMEEVEHKKIIDAYDDEVSYSDRKIEQFINFCENRFKTDNMVFAVTADHGEIFGEHNCFQHAYHMWEPVVRVPFIIKSKLISSINIKTDHPATHTDIMPTLLYLAKIPFNTDYGDTLFKSSDNLKIIITAYDARGVKRTAARQGVIKLVKYEKVNKKLFESLGKEDLLIQFPSLNRPAPFYELYNLEDDFKEQNNILDTFENSELVELLKESIEKYNNPVKKAVVEKEIKLDNETLEALKAAGYIR